MAWRGLLSRTVTSAARSSHSLSLFTNPMYYLCQPPSSSICRMTTKIEKGQIEPDIYIRTWNYDCPITDWKKQYSWYVIKGDNTTPEHEFLPPQLAPLPHHFQGSAVASIGSTVFVCGGQPCKHNDPPPTNEAYYIDTCRPNDGWKKTSPMNAFRSYPYAFFHGDKMYVVGDKDLTPWAEVYDLTSDTWHALPNVPDEWAGVYVKGHAVIDKRILFYSLLNLEKQIFYDMELELWGSLGNNCLGNYCSVRDDSFAYMNGVIYFVHHGVHDNALCYYDVSKPGSDSMVVNGLTRPTELLPAYNYNDRFDDYQRHKIVSLGDEKLAVIWEMDGDYQSLHCTKFQILKLENSLGELDIQAKVIHTSCHYVPWSIIDCCITVFGPDQELRDPTSSNRLWTSKEDSKLTDALRILKKLGKYTANDGFEPGVFIDVEKVLEVLIPKSRINSLHIKSRIDALKSQTDFVHDI